MTNRTDATSFLNRPMALAELDKLHWAIVSLQDLVTVPGSCQREVMDNVCKGIKARINYLHDSFEWAFEQEREMAVRDAVAKRLSK